MLVDAMAVAAATGSPGDRLYAAAVLQRQRQEERNRLQQQADRAATQWVAPRSAYQVVPRVYEEPAAPGSKAKPGESSTIGICLHMAALRLPYVLARFA